MTNEKTLWMKLRPYLNSAPALTLIGLIVLFPILYTFYISLTNMNIYNWFTFRIIGFDNYRRALFVLDSGFFRAVYITIIWTVVNMVLQLVFAFIIATLLNNKYIKFKGLYKTLLMVPWAIPGYVSILLWKTGMFNSEFGLLNQWMDLLGFNRVDWLSNEFSAFVSLVVVNLWLALPFMIMIMDGALQSIDRSYYEAAELEAASKFKQATLITIPLIRPAIGPAVIITIFTTFKQFDIFYLLTLQPGSRTGANLHTIITYAYENAFITNNYGYSSAISIIIFFMLIGFVVLTNKNLRRAQND
ncbi:MAG: carbohydrate ABC transporter permease [Candidatus Izemoplasmataceae bacterium]|uniref:carbohydrate ABC transporter permease n=1 Tax=Liberiplasma polymorphum TaxID=3374570 RepID=UPI0037756C56